MNAVTVTEHAAFRASLENHDTEEIDIALADINPPSRRKESEVKRLLSILDKLQTEEEQLA